jgi:hypothetical protein
VKDNAGSLVLPQKGAIDPSCVLVTPQNLEKKPPLLLPDIEEPPR